MAIKVSDEFGSRANPPTQAYPSGSLKDETNPGASNDGSPLSSRVGNDFQGFMQSALSEAGIDANGNPDSVENPQILNAIKKVQESHASTYTDIVYKASDGNSAVGNMIAGVPVEINIGERCSTGGTLWELKTKSSPIVLSDFEPIGCLFVDDFGYTSDDSQVVINTALQSYKHVGLIGGSTHTISQGIELSLNNQCFDYSLATIKWKDNISVASRMETISATNLNDIKIICGLVDGNKDNQSNIPDTPPVGASYGSFIRLNNCLSPSVYNPKAIDLCGYGIMLYGTSRGRFYNTSIINCGNKRTVNYDVSDQTISGEQYSSNNVGDGVYISDGSSSNLFFGFTCGHDTTIQSASSMRAGITFVNGSYNKFYGSTLYNMSRVIHFEPNASGESCRYNEINGLEIPAIGSIQTCVTQYEVDNGQLRFNEISKFECLAQNTLTNGAKKTSVFSSLFIDDIQSDYKMKYTDGKFPEWVEVNNGDVLLENVQARGINSRSPGGVQNRLHVIGGAYDNLDLQVGKDILLDGVGIRLPGNIIGGSSAQDGELKKIEIKNGRYTLPSGSTVSFFSRLFAEANLHDNEFLYDGTVDSSGGWIDAYGRVGASDDLLRLASNTFKIIGSGKPSHAIKAMSNASVSYVTDSENLTFGSFTNGFAVDMGKFFGAAPTKN